MAIYGLVRSSLAKKEELTGEEMADIVRKAEQLGGGPKGVADGCGKFSWQRGLALFAAERPEGCFAQTVPVPFVAKKRCQTLADTVIDFTWRGG